LRADAYASLAGALFLGIALLSLFGIARGLGASVLAAALVPLAFAFSPVIAQASGTLCASDLGGPAAALAAIAFLSPPPTVERRPLRRPELVCAGLAAGFALGCRPQLWIALVVAAGLAIAAAPDARTLRGGGRRVLLLSAAAAATGSGWYLRNLLLTGNPVYPLELGPLRGPLRGDALART
jgi:hypothetical protein